METSPLLERMKIDFVFAHRRFSSFNFLKNDIKCYSNKKKMILFLIMSLSWVNVTGFLGGGFSAIMFIPQILKMYQTKLAQDISTCTLLMGILASGLIFTHACFIWSHSLIIGCAISITIRGLTLLYKLKLDSQLPHDVCKG